MTTSSKARQAVEAPAYTRTEAWTTLWGETVWRMTPWNPASRTYLQFGSLELDEATLGPAGVNTLRCTTERGDQL
jgi:hypothetical protein